MAKKRKNKKKKEKKEQEVIKRENLCEGKKKRLSRHGKNADF